MIVGGKPSKAVKDAGAKTHGSYLPLSGSEKAPVPNSQYLGPVDPESRASVTVRVRSSGEISDLEKIVSDMYSVPSRRRVYLSRAELKKKYGARDRDLDLVEIFANKHNLRVHDRSSSRRSLVLSGTIKALMNAFHIDLGLYRHLSVTYRGRKGSIFIPRELSGVVTGVFGLDTRPLQRSPAMQSLTSPALSSPADLISGLDMAKRYKFPKRERGVELDGSGQCIGLIELGGSFNRGDLRTYCGRLGVEMPSLTAVSVDGSVNTPQKANPSDGEVMMDIEVISSVVPRARIAVYLAPNQGSGFLDAVSGAVSDLRRPPGVLSISWGEAEAFVNKQTRDAFHEVFLHAAALGITVCVASGDHGTAELNAFQWDGNVHVRHPASDQLVLACGGTQIDDKNRDVVWNDGTPFNKRTPDGGGWASGGGISQVVSLPNYQQKVKLPTPLRNGRIGRGIPDVAMCAVPYLVRVGGQDGPGGGTSAVAPLMGSLVTRLNQAKKRRFGCLNSFLYSQIGTDVFGIVAKGSNTLVNTLEGYRAAKRWNACTGLGTPNGRELLDRLWKS
jgi:kumamolisin